MSRRTSIFSVTIALAVLAVAFFAKAAAQRNFDDVEVKSEKVAEGIYVLFGAGGNIGLCVGDDNVFMIDDQYAPLTDKIKAAVAKLSDKPVQFVLNTHYHGDHVGGNEQLGEEGSVIVAHENVRKRLTTEQFSEMFNRTTPAYQKDAWPIITFTRDIKFHMNGKEISVFHVEHAHTDGDAIVRFMNSNVVHMGDTYFEGLYPFIDVEAGGSVDGMIDAVDRVLPTIDENTVVIPGHGPVSNKAKLVAFRDMLKRIRDNVNALAEQGKTLEEVTAAKPTAEFDEVWGNGFLKPDVFTKIVYTDLKPD